MGRNVCSHPGEARVFIPPHEGPTRPIPDPGGKILSNFYEAAKKTPLLQLADNGRKSGLNI
jgi:hypothetical protein